jgi:hypothetical protein
MDSQQPPPNTSHKPSIAGETVVELLYSPSQRERGIITLDAQGLFRVRTDFWDVSDWDFIREAYWCQKHIGTFTDTLTSARTLCLERLK